jgi:hypothetical protein
MEAKCLLTMLAVAVMKIVGPLLLLAALVYGVTRYRVRPAPSKRTIKRPENFINARIPDGD